MGDEVSAISDETLGQQAGEDREGAFAELLRRYQSPLISFLRRFTANLSDAEDLLQETVYRLYAGRGQYRPAWRYRTWAFTIARRVAIDALRKRDAESRALLQNVDRYPQSSGQAGSASVLSDGIWETARRVLTTEQADALWLFHVEQLPPREIARVLDRSWVSVKTMLFRARRRVRDELILAGELRVSPAKGGTR